jgi:heme/copper-type cytochrome/quinol oxidase subunit 3
MDAAQFREPNRGGLMQSTILLVLAAESVLFGTLVMAYLFLRGGGATWTFTPPGPVDIAIAALNTLVLLGSAVAARRALTGIAHGSIASLKKGLLLASLLGMVFVAGQIFEFRHSGMSLRDFSFAGIFFALISFHAAHVLAGMAVLGLNLARAQAGDFTARRHVAITAGTWFWYFVVAVWLVLFTILYII